MMSGGFQMLAVERYEKIMAELQENKIIKVSELSASLAVTEKTIRVDLETLEKQGLLKRIHGGAVLPEKETRIFPIDERQSMRSDVKLAIAKEAIKTVKPNETILMDGGSTTQALANLLGEIPVTVITNDIKIANTLLAKEKVQLLVLGGTSIHPTSSLYGVEAIEKLKRIRVNRLFFGTTGVSIEHGLTVLHSLHAEWKRQILLCADYITLLTDSSKFDKVGFIQFANINELDEIITDENINPLIYKELQAKNVKVSVTSL
ncbi:DeoR/GlpR family DNA-binding transcription regulator [Alkalihalobacillus sp. LMS39]|uniref:DeoR/GlpR family DNA-binding transcription regulator n=1 Tax=Alkalihalobacillus sp. LMS39 TaxID=2924032 RepID=UPI001FB1E951|nr:DeoR/GlpR family DNA-binding transcription regulator [Alkalihalobacillus sp. LMS39]UOE94940.1 DeoR/GlpR family DNA-binding transcription regulator [Alkalihalobacillus sp. LMS39]